MDKIFDFIDRQRGKSEGSRQRLAFGSALGLTALVATIWFTAFSPFGPSQQAVAVANEPEAPSPLGALTDLGKDFANQVGSLWFSLGLRENSQTE